LNPTFSPKGDFNFKNIIFLYLLKVKKNPNLWVQCSYFRFAKKTNATRTMSGIVSKTGRYISQNGKRTNLS
jgi:hypothetical protein